MRSLHLDAVWLRLKYETEGLSTYAIAKIVKRNPKNIYVKLRDFGIPTRPRGLNLKGRDNYMAQPGVQNPFQGKKHTLQTRKRLSEKASVPKPYLRGTRNGMSGRIGAMHPHYIDGSSPERQGLYARGEWKEMTRYVYARDRYQCHRCKSTKKEKRGLHVHHVKPWAGNKEARFDKTNLITLCRSCHSWVHSAANKKRDYLS